MLPALVVAMLVALLPYLIGLCIADRRRDAIADEHGRRLRDLHRLSREIGRLTGVDETALAGPLVVAYSRLATEHHALVRRAALRSLQEVGSDELDWLEARRAHASGARLAALERRLAATRKDLEATRMVRAELLALEDDLEAIAASVRRMREECAAVRITAVREEVMNSIDLETDAACFAALGFVPAFEAREPVSFKP